MRDEGRLRAAYNAAMATLPSLPVTDLRQALADHGFAFVTADTMQPLLTAVGGLADWETFAKSWERLGPDAYLAAKGRARRRRHAVFKAEAGQITAMPHQPHYQALQYNNLQGDIERWFEPIEGDIAQGESLNTILRFCQIGRAHV